MRTLNILFVFISLIVCNHIKADVRVAGCFGNNMVLQRDMPVKFWGWAKPGEQITVSIEKHTAKSYTDSIGKWMVVLENLKTGGPYEIKITGEYNTIVFNNVYVGEVWLCSGQSNMDMTVAREDRYWCGVINEAEEVAKANYPLIRVFDVPFVTKDEPQDSVSSQWEICSPKTVGHFSAAAYFFARELYNKYKVPIGLITSSYGASTVEAWTSRPALENKPEFKELLDNYESKCRAYDTSEQTKIKYNEALEKWKKECEKAKAEGKDKPKEPKNPNPHQDQHSPAVLYNGMIAPIIPYTIRGVIWYQGESNTSTASIYDLQMEALIYDWRQAWKQGDFPFIYVQLANYQKLIEEPVKDDPFVLVREKQLKNLSVRNTAMVVAIDNADPDNPGNIHPKNKQDIGKRLAIAAMGKVYNESVTYMGPIFDYMKIQNEKIILYFKFADKGLTFKGDKLKGFAIAAEDKKFVWADAVIDKNTVILKSSDVKNPMYVRYGWAKNPQANLYNTEGLPASPFRTDDF
jgi:sialate O-acetylesterase